MPQRASSSTNALSSTYVARALAIGSIFVVESIVLLHGFGGTHRAWDGVVAQLDRTRYRVLAIDLPGHGQLANVDGPITFATCVEHVLGHAPDRFTLCGYSMGGRIALHVALAAPERVQRLVLVSGSPGIEDPRQRAARRQADRRLAVELGEMPFERFIERWASQPLFAFDPVEVQAQAGAEQRRNSPSALAAVLRGIGTGKMQPLWDRLEELTMPVTVAVGERDVAYQTIARRMVARLPSGRLAILPGGHRLPLESPGELARVVTDDWETQPHSSFICN
jgi:2-succinyl-6-hydroxy-2,4-cyclohexadiene-1-carboxylate synthase